MTIETILIVPQIAFDVALAIAVLLGRTHGGLTFCRLGRFGFSFYIAKGKQVTRTTIYHSDRFDVVSYGNGTSYAIHDNINRISAFIQGADDTAEFRDELRTWDTMFPTVSYDDFYAEQIAVRQS